MGEIEQQKIEIEQFIFLINPKEEKIGEKMRHAIDWTKKKQQ